MADGGSKDIQTGLMSRLVSELFGSPLNLVLLGICSFLVYKIFSGRRNSGPPSPKEPELPPLKKQDFTIEQLREYDGKAKEGRILIAVNNKVFDVTKGKRFYGPGIKYEDGIFVLCQQFHCHYVVNPITDHNRDNAFDLSIESF